MKGVIPFRGVGIPTNRKLLATWRAENGIDRWPVERQLEVALAFLGEPIAEDKLAGILYLQDYLDGELSWEVLVAEYEGIYANELIFDWNVCDWFCVRVLGPMVKSNGVKCAEAIASWREAEYLWQARSSVVPFVTVASESEYYSLIRKACVVLISREERFSKTAVGWVLHAISTHDESFVVSFVEENLESFSKESLGSALRYFDKGTKGEYSHRLKRRETPTGLSA